MSAYIVTKEHIQYLIAAMQSRRICQSYGFSYWNGQDRIAVRAGDYAQCAAIGTLLWQENVKSVNARYQDQSDAGRYTLSASEASHTIWQEIDPVQVIKACHCLEYQSCEHDGWETSDAKRILDTLIKCACHALSGYDQAEWGAPETTAAKTARVRVEMRPTLATLFRN